MLPHPSDLSLERLLKGEARPPEEREHVHRCDACWSRWQALHADEGWSQPTRVSPSAPPLPPPARLPWMVAAGSTAFALAALALLFLRAPSAGLQSEIVHLEGQVDTLQAEVREAREELVETRRGSAGATSSEGGAVRPGAETRVVAGSTPAERARVERLVEERLEAREAEEREAKTEAKTEALDAAKDEALPRGSDAIGVAVDRLVEVDGLAEEAAGTVQDLLEAEMDETWRIKEAVAAGELSEKEGWGDWASLRAETDEALLELLEPEEVKALREELDGGGK